MGTGVLGCIGAEGIAGTACATWGKRALGEVLTVGWALAASGAGGAIGFLGRERFRDKP